VVVNPGGEVHSITQPVELPAGWAEETLDIGARCRTMAAGYAAIEERNLRTFRVEDFLSAVVEPRYFKVIEPNVTRSSVRHSAWPSASIPASPPGNPARLLREDGFTLFGEFEQDEHGIVYKNRDRRGRLVSVRILAKPTHVAGQVQFEALEKKLTALKLPGLAPILRLIADPAAGFVVAVVSEYVAGPSLRWYLSQGSLPDSREAARLVLALAEVLGYAGRRGMVHGNIRPETIRTADDGRPRITGLGLVRLDCGPAVSSEALRAYVAPELLAGGGGARPTPRSDVYSLGVIFRELLGGSNLQSNASIDSRVPAELSAICARSTAAEPTARYATAGELAAALRKSLGVRSPGLLKRLTRGSKSKLGEPPLWPGRPPESA
jgi:serine/threonine protein kinase